MGIIEQAARRLEQLRQAGIAVPETATPGADTHASGNLPVRLVAELEAKSARAEPAAHAAPAGAGRAAAPLSSPSDESARVEIDLGRLAALGYVTPNASRSRLAEEFRVIKRPLLNNVSGKSASPVQRANRIMVTSSLPGEGKTFVALNLAMSLAMELDTDVLLVDADASRPALLERLGLEPTKGLMDLLVEPDLPLSSAILKTNVERLAILPAGSPQLHATELLASDAMSHLVARLATDERRVVLFDTPPLLAASESRVLAAHMGQVVMVIASGDTAQGTVAEALGTIETCPVVFTLLNRVAPADRGHYYGTYSAYAR